ncbi:MAG TPA: FHA domain-containing protein, partial [Myxococcaceae bacterium]
MLSVRVENCATHQFTEHTFQRSPVRIGRNALNELSLQEGYVSLSHAVLRFDPERIQVIDLGSTNGTHVDGKRIESNVPVTLKDSSDLRIGDLRLHLQRASGSGASAAQQNRDRTQFRLMTQDVRAAAAPVPAAVPSPLPAAPPRPAGERIPAPPTQFVPPASSPPRTGSTPAPTPVPATAVVMPPPAPAAAQSRVAISSFPQSSDSGATLLDVDLLQLALGQDVAARPGAEEALAHDVASATYPLYVEYRKAWRKLHEALQAKAGHLPLAQRAGLAGVLERQMPTLYQEEQFRAFA